MTTQRRSATFQAVLVYMDEPQLITLVARKTKVVAVAIPSDNEDSSLFIAVTVSGKDWERYLDGKVDLRYLFTIPTVKTIFHFDLLDMEDSKVMMSPWKGEVDEQYLPSPRFFSSNHTEHYELEERPTDTETLFIDGEWELTDFGQFQQKFSDIYTYLISEKNWRDKTLPVPVRRRVQEAFLDRPFKGGFSYVHLFRDLAKNMPRSDQLNLNKIQYASPGHVEIFGKQEVFESLSHVLENFLENRDEIVSEYNKFYKYLSERHYLRMSGDQFNVDEVTEEHIQDTARKLSERMLAPNYDAVSKLTDDNALVSAKVVMAFYRRLADAALYFAQGRVGYSE